jgi:hypothetical protein
MNLSESQLTELELYSSYMFTVEEIAVIIQVNPAELAGKIKDKASTPYLAFARGRLKMEAELRKSIFDLAKNGSSPAQSYAMKLIEKAKLDDT